MSGGAGRTPRAPGEAAGFIPRRTAGHDRAGRGPRAGGPAVGFAPRGDRP